MIVNNSNSNSLGIQDPRRFISTHSLYCADLFSLLRAVSLIHAERFAHAAKSPFVGGVGNCATKDLYSTRGTRMWLCADTASKHRGGAGVRAQGPTS